MPMFTCKGKKSAWHWLKQMTQADATSNHKIIEKKGK